jgi:hypothetical protein
MKSHQLALKQGVGRRAFKRMALEGDRVSTYDVETLVAYPWEGTGRMHPLRNWRGAPMYLSPRFHSAIFMEIPLGRYRVIEYSALF